MSNDDGVQLRWVPGTYAIMIDGTRAYDDIDHMKGERVYSFVKDEAIRITKVQPHGSYLMGFIDPLPDDTGSGWISLQHTETFKIWAKKVCFKLGEEVLVRSSGQSWKIAVVTCLSPLQAKPSHSDQWQDAQQTTWDEIKPVSPEEKVTLESAANALRAKKLEEAETERNRNTNGARLACGDCPKSVEQAKTLPTYTLSQQTPALSQQTPAFRPEWPCPVCTYKNSGNIERCEMCGQGSPPSARTQTTISRSPASYDNPVPWTCLLCTYANPATLDKCQMCSSGRPVTKSSESPIGTAKVSNTNEWSCLICTLLNPAQNDVCDGCFTERPQ